MIHINQIKPNPYNPRFIKKYEFKKLVSSISAFPKMMELRPIIVDDNWFIIGGNMRFMAIKEIGIEELSDSWVKQVKDLTQDEINEFIIKDNLQFGEWDWDMLANEWEEDLLEEWGLKIPIFKGSAKPAQFETESEYMIQVVCKNQEEQNETLKKIRQMNVDAFAI